MPAGKSDNDDYDDWMMEIYRKNEAERGEKRREEMQQYLSRHREELVEKFHALTGEQSKAILMKMMTNDLLYSLREELLPGQM